jgi:hypothetical protein
MPEKRRNLYGLDPGTKGIIPVKTPLAMERYIGDRFA